MKSRTKRASDSPLDYWGCRHMKLCSWGPHLWPVMTSQVKGLRDRGACWDTKFFKNAKTQIFLSIFSAICIKKTWWTFEKQMRQGIKIQLMSFIVSLHGNTKLSITHNITHFNTQQDASRLASRKNRNAAFLYNMAYSREVQRSSLKPRRCAPMRQVFITSFFLCVFTSYFTPKFQVT